MKRLILIISAILVGSLFLVFNSGFKDAEVNNKISIKYNYLKEFKDYWLAGKAEISSYELSKARYGEIHKGDAILLYVVEPFLPTEQVKSDGIKATEKSESVMKLIKKDNFFTGIYPYSIMTSTFYPLNKNRDGLLKVSMSSQDWCGQIFSQINNREDHLDVQRYSYFQKEGDVKEKMEMGLLEEELFTQVRIDPNKLPLGKFELYPSSEYTRLLHKEFKKYNAEASIDNINEVITKYKLDYSDLNRKLEINFETKFPHKIIGWQETYTGLRGKILTTSAKLKNNLNIAYWKHNSIADSTYRKLLGL